MNGLYVLMLLTICRMIDKTTTLTIAKRRDEPDDETARYCQICRNHTMCRFPYDDPGPNCLNLENGDLDAEEIEWIVHRHNLFRSGIAGSNGRKTRGKHAARAFYPTRGAMMQVFWDDELARIARRWALQCNVFEKDECRDVGRFPVLQNVDALYLPAGEDNDVDTAYNHSSLERLEFHITSWYQEAVTLASGRRTVGNSTYVIGLSTPWVTNMGCARAIYHVIDNNDDNDYGNVGEKNSQIIINDDDTENSSFLLDRVEILICNYGPANRTVATIGLQKGRKRCQSASRQYVELCVNSEAWRTPTKMPAVIYTPVLTIDASAGATPNNLFSRSTFFALLVLFLLFVVF